MTVIQLADNQLPELARLIAQELQSHGRAERSSDALDGALVDAATLASLLGVSRSTVYALADELGAIRLGSGSKPRLRFDVEQAKAAMSCCVGKGSQATVANTDGRLTTPPDRARRRLPSQLPKPGSVLTVRRRQGAR